MRNYLPAAKPVIAFGLFIAILALFADFISPNPPDMQDLGSFFSPPARIHFVDEKGEFHWHPFVYRTQITNLLDTTYAEIPEKAYPLEFFFGGYEYRFLGWIPANIHLIGVPEEGVFYAWGADELGRDVFARVLAGARTSLLVIVLGISLYALLGVAIGALAGWLGGWADAILMRTSELVLALPALYLILALRAILPLRMPYYQTVFLTVGTIALVTWPPMARGVRGIILQLRNAGYVEAARSLGCTEWQIFSRHIFPSLVPFVLAQAVAASPIFLLGEVTLSFLGVGFQGSAASWGAMMRSLRDPRILTDFWWNLAPLFMVLLTLFCLHLSSGRRPEDQTIRL